MDITTVPLEANISSFETTTNSSDDIDTPVFNISGCDSFQSDVPITNGVKIFFYSVVFLFSVLGNSLLIVIIKKTKRMQTITNYLIANMADSDLLMTVLAVPREITEIILGLRRWLIDGALGSFLCKSVAFFQDISTAVSILSLVVIAIDRYRGIVFPWRKPLMKPAKLCKVIIPLIWLVSMGLHAVYFYTFRIVTYDKKTYCISSWAPKYDQKNTQEIYYIILLVCLIAIPACILTSLYSVIIFNLKKTRIATCRGPSNSMTSRRLQEDMKVVRNIIAILVAFTVCITPINVFAIMFYFVWDFKIPCGMEGFGFAAHLFLYLSALVNPCIYYIFNDKYRQGILNIFHKVSLMDRSKTKRKKTSRNSMETWM